MRELGAVLSAVTLAVTLGACDPDGAAVTTDPAALARSIDRATAKAGTAHVEITATMNGGLTITGEGGMRIGRNETPMSLDMRSPRGPATAVVLDGKAYYLPEGNQAPKPWFGFDATGEPGRAREIQFLIRPLRVNADPRRLIEQLRTVGTITAEERGVDLNGVTTTHYRFTMTVRELVDQSPTLGRAMESARIRDFPVELWIDADGMPVRVKTNTPALSPTFDEAYESSVVVDYTDWGTPVTITAPAPNEVQWMPT